MKAIGTSRVTTITPQRKVIAFTVQTPIGEDAGSARIIATAEEADINQDGAKVRSLGTLDLETTGAQLIAAGHVDAERFAALYTEISNIFHRAFDELAADQD